MKLASLIGVVLALVSRVAAAGVLFEIETQNGGNSPRRAATITMAVEGPALVMEMEAKNGRPGGQVIYRRDRNEMVITDNQRKSYLVMNTDTIRAISSLMGKSTNRIDEAQRIALPERQASFGQVSEGQLAGQSSATDSQVEVRQVDDRAMVNHYPCDRYEVWRDGRKIQDIWATAWENVEGGREFAPLFYAMADFFREMTSVFSGRLGAATARLEDNMFTMIAELNAFPIASREYSEVGTPRNASILRNAWPRPIPSAAFEPPPTYRQQDLLDAP